MSADVWSAIGALATVVGSGAAVTAAAIAVKSLTAIKNDSADRSRPVVIAELATPPLHDHEMNLVVSNQGASAARDLRVTFVPDPLILPNDPRPAKLAPYLIRRYAHPIALLPAGGRLSNVYAGAVGQGVGESKELDEPLPTQFSVRVEYFDMDRRRRYEDSFELDVEVLATATYARPGGKDYEKRTAHALEAVARGVGDS